MLCFEMANALQAVVMYVDGVMVYMQRRHHNQRQIDRQQHPRSYAPNPIHNGQLTLNNSLYCIVNVYTENINR